MEWIEMRASLNEYGWSAYWGENAWGAVHIVFGCTLRWRLCSKPDQFNIFDYTFNSIFSITHSAHHQNGSYDAFIGETKFPSHALWAITKMKVSIICVELLLAFSPDADMTMQFERVWLQLSSRIFDSQSNPIVSNGVVDPKDRCQNKRNERKVNLCVCVGGWLQSLETIRKIDAFDIWTWFSIS